MPARLTLENFIEKARKIHGNEYDYSKVIYKNNSTKVCIICPIHGEFWQIPNSHIDSKCGCPICRYIKSSKSNSLTLENFIEKARKIHGNEYDYSKVIYKNNSTKVCIICPIHGEFWQTPNDHNDDKNFCPKCSYKKMGDRNRKTTLEFINQSNIKHNYFFNYSKVIYKNNSTKVCIVCPMHGEFWQIPNDHIRGIAGCPGCYFSKGEKEIKKILEENAISYKSQVSFKNCVSKGRLRFDFGIYKEDKLILLLEFDGKQHFEPVIFSYSQNPEENFEYVKQKDLIKNTYCLNNNIKLKRINYKQNIYNEMLLIIKEVKSE